MDSAYGGSIRTSLSPTPDMSIQSKKMADNWRSLKYAEDMLIQSVTITEAASGAVRQMLSPLIDRYIVPLLEMSREVSGYLGSTAEQISDFVDDFGMMVDGDFELLLIQKTFLSDDLQTLAQDATAIHTTAANASQLLAKLQNRANETSAALNNYKLKLEEADSSLAQRAQKMKVQMHDMTSGNCCEQIGHAFQLALGDLKEKLEKSLFAIHQTEYELMLNNNAIDGLAQLLIKLGDIASVAAALDVSWRSVADQIGMLQQDVDILVGAISNENTRGYGANTSGADTIKSDFAYANSDWQSIAQILAKISE